MNEDAWMNGFNLNIIDDSMFFIQPCKHSSLTLWFRLCQVIELAKIFCARWQEYLYNKKNLTEWMNEVEWMNVPIAYYQLLTILFRLGWLMN
ncbi:MAG: hypothetical protein WC557_06920 [Ignavibacteriaceae bacterium]